MEMLEHICERAGGAGGQERCHRAVQRCGAFADTTGRERIT